MHPPNLRRSRSPEEEAVPARRRLPARALLAICLWVLGAPIALAHDVSPSSIRLRPGGTDFIYVDDPLDCTATIHANSTNPAAVTVCALVMDGPNQGDPQPGCGGGQSMVTNRDDQVFVITASPGITSTVTLFIEVCWVGDPPSCLENNCSPPAPHLVAVTVEPDPAAAGASLAAGVASDPVATASGELFLVEPPDLDAGGPMPLWFGRYYGSRLEADGAPAGRLGPNWRHNFDWHVESTGHNLEIRSPTGRVLRFERGFFEADWTLAPYDDLPYELADGPGGSLVLGELESQRIFVFDAARQLISVADGRGNSHALDWSGGRISRVSDGLGRSIAFSYSGASGLLVGATDGVRSVVLGYTGGALTSVTDVLGNDTTYAYDPSQPGAALLVARTLPRGNTPFTQAWDLAGRVVSQTDADGHVWTFDYDPPSGVTTITDPSSGAREHEHSPAAELTGVVDEDGAAAALAYDPSGRRTALTDRLGGQTSWTWDAASGQLASSTEADGRSTALTYSGRTVAGIEFHDLTAVDHPDGTSEAFEYDAGGNLLCYTDRAGNEWSYTYDARGQVVTETNPAGGTTTFTYNADGTLDSVIDAAGSLTAIGYDALRRPVLVTLPDATTLSYAYDAKDRLQTFTNELGETVSFAHDPNHNLKSVTDAALGTWQLTHDAMDRLAEVSDPLGNALSATFDGHGRAARVEDGNGNGLSFGYDAQGRLASVADDLGHAWTLGRDAEGVPVSRTDPLGHALSFAADELGRVTRATSELGHSTSLLRDAMGRVTRVTDPLGRRTTFDWSAAGELSEVSAPGGLAATYARNGLQRVVQATDPGGETWGFAFDALGRRTSRTDPLGRVTSFEHDQRHRVSRVVLPGAADFIDVTSDAAGRLARLDASDGTIVQYGYDAAGRLVSGTALTLGWDAAGRMTGSNGIAIGRDAAGRIESVTLAPGKVVTYAYDERDLLVSVTDWVGGATTFAWDGARRLVSLARPNGVTTTYDWDDGDRLVGIQHGTLAEIALARDGAGQITSATRTVPLDSTPAPESQSLAFDGASQEASAVHDDLGRVIDDGARTYTWDLLSRLTGYQEAGASAGFLHDALGNVVVRSEGGVTRSQFWNYALGLPSVAIVRQGGQHLRYYVHTPGGLLLHSVEAAGGERRFHHFDEMGSTVLLTDDAGAVTDTYAYGPWGEVLAETGSHPNPYRWLGRYGVAQETASGLYLMRARPYDGASGRFLARDPLELLGPRGINPYAYAFGNPLLWIDPRGTAPEVPAQQIGVEARFLSVDSDFLQDIGVDFRLPGAGVAAAPAANKGAAPTASPELLSDLAARVVLHATQSARPSRSLSAPRVGLLDAQRSHPLIQDQTGFVSDVETAVAPLLGQAAVGELATGVVLDVRPVVSADLRFVTIEIRPAVAPIGIAAPARSLRNIVEKLRAQAARRRPAIADLPILGRAIARTGVTVPDGGTVLLGGVRRGGTQGDPRGPILGDVPILGYLFRANRQTSMSRELQVLITPHIVEER